MRLPESMTRIAPVGAVLSAEEAGETLLSAAVEHANDELFVSSADASGLSQWEKDYALADGTGESAERRRGRIRAAMAGGQTLTRERLRALAVNVGGAAEGEVVEDFAAYAVELNAIGAGKFPTAGGMAALREAASKQKPAHLSVTVVPCAEMRSERNEARHGGLLRFVWAGNARSAACGG